MFKRTAQPFVSVELEPVAGATTAVSQDIWRAHAQALLAQVVLLVLAVVSELLAVDLVEDLPLEVDLQVDPVLLLATNVVDRTTLLVTAKLRP